MPKGNNKGDPKRDENVDSSTPGKMWAIATDPRVMFIFMVTSVAVIGVLVAFVVMLNQQQNIFLERIQEINQQQNEFLERIQKLEKSITRDCKVECLDGTSVQTIEDRIRKGENRMGQLNEHLDKTIIDLKEVQKRQDSYTQKDTSHVDINNYIEDIDKQLYELMQRNKSEVRMFIMELMKQLQDKFVKLQQTFDQSDKTNKENVRQQNKKIQGQFNTFEEKLKEVKEYARRVDVIVKKNEDEIGNIKSKSDLFKEVILDKVDRTREKVENVERDNISFGMYFILILVAMVIMVFLIVNWVHVKFRDGQSLFNRMYSTTGVSHPTRLSQPLRSVLDDIGRKQLENKVCILSFYAETQNLHKRLTDSACQGLHIMQEQYLIGKHEHVPNIPPCRIVLVFVDFNERDIILENPKREVGDLKLTTVKGARKMGCDVFVIYVRDKGSKALVDGKLFNPNLMSVFEHEELRDLNGRKRVMSTYENFTQYQVRHLYECFRRLR